MKVSLVIPCYNEEKNVELVYNAIKKVFAKTKYKPELIFINDGSNDKTIVELRKLVTTASEEIVIIDFSRNFKKEAAIYAGLKNATGDYVSLIDADMQQNPKYVIEMLDFLEKNSDYDCVAMYQEKRKEGVILSFFKRGFYKFINKVSDVSFVNGASDFRTMRKNVKDSILELNEYYRFSKGIFSWVGFNTYYISYVVDERVHGMSTWSFKSLFKYAMEGIIAFTTAPLKLATIVGLLSFLGSILYIAIVIIEKLCFGIVAEGYATIIILILLLGGLQLFALGIIGEYLARTYIETKKRPIYIVREIIKKEGKK